MAEQDNQTQAPVLDASVLSGGAIPDAGISGTSAPPPSPAPQVPTPIPQAAPATSSTGGAPVDAGVTTGPAAPPQAAGQRSVWKDIVMGALYGLAGSAGSKHFGGGLAQGAAGYLEGKQREVENLQNASKLQFESLQAADSHVKALAEIRSANQLSDERALEYKQKSAEYQSFLQDNFGIEPDLTFNDSHDAGTAALQTSADRNGGTIPPATIVHQPEPQGTHGQVAAYSPSNDQMKRNVNRFRDLINTQRAAQGLPSIDNPTFNSLGFKGQRDAAQKAIEFFKPTPAYSLDKSKPDYLPIVLEQRKQTLAQYSAHKDENGKPDADPNTEKQLQNSIDYLDDAWNDTNKMEGKQASDLAKQTTQAKLDAENSPANVQATASGAAAKAGAVEQAKQNVMAGGAAAGEGGSSLVDSIGQGKLPMQRVEYMLARNPELLAAVVKAYPDFDASKVKSYGQTYQEFTSTKPGTAGAALNAGGTALKHLWELEQLNTLDSRRPGSSAKQAYDNKLDTVVAELAQFYKVPQTDKSIEAIRSTLGATFNRESAIKTQAQSMSDKLGSFEQQWKNAAPSKSYQAALPNIDEEAKAALVHFNPGFTKEHPDFAPKSGGNTAPQSGQAQPVGATHTGKGSDGNMYYLGAGGQILGKVQ